MADHRQPPKVHFNYHPSDTVLLVVGKEPAEMLVHKCFISAHSEFFKTALKKRWREGLTRVVKMPEHEPEVVAQYLDFIYHKKLPTQQTARSPELVYIDLARLYVFGESVLDRHIQNAIVDHLIHFTTLINRNDPRHGYYPGPATVDVAYDGTPAGSPIRRLLVDMYVRHGSKEWLVESLHPWFSLDVARGLMVKVEDFTLGRSAPATVIRKADYYHSET